MQVPIRTPSLLVHRRTRIVLSLKRYRCEVVECSISHFLSSKNTLSLLIYHGLTSLSHIIFHPHTSSVCFYYSTSSSVLHSSVHLPLLPPSHVVNITLITHLSFKCPHYGYQTHLWPFGPIDWHNQYVILAKFGDATLELPDALKALSSNSYGDGDSSLC